MPSQELNSQSVYRVLTAVGDDRVGLLGTISRAAADLKVAIIESIAHAMGGQAMLFLHLNGSDRDILACLERLHEEFRNEKLDLRLEDAGPPGFDEQRWLSMPWRVQAVAEDRDGVLAEVAELMAQHGVIITSYHDEPFTAPHATRRMRIMTFSVRLPRVFDRGAFTADMHIIAEGGHILSMAHSPM